MTVSFEQAAIKVEKAQEFARLQKAIEQAFLQDKGRRSGKTTRGLLLALAEAVEIGHDSVIVSGHNDRAEETLARHAEELVASLGISIKIIRSSKAKQVIYAEGAPS